MAETAPPLNRPQQKWKPGPRPDWVRQVNAEGEAMDLIAVVPLDPQSLIDAAMTSTGLSDFGVDDWREPFEILCRSLDEDAHLNLLGRVRTRSDLLNLLKARLQIEETYRQHPEIEAETIDAPLFIVGQGRTGTSYLLNLLNSSPDNGGFQMWEGMFPCPPPEAASFDSDPRIERADRLLTLGNRLTPELIGLHEFTARLPQEDGNLLGLAFRHIGWFNVMAQVGQYNEYMMQADMSCAYRYMKRVLKLLGCKNPRRQWVLKDPTHLEMIPTVLKVFPDAGFIWTHRDPSRAVTSTIGLIGTMLWSRTDHPFKGASMDNYMDPAIFARQFDVVIDQLESGEIPKERVFHLLYRDLVNDPIGTADAIHAHFGMAFPAESRAAIAAYVQQNPRESRPGHVYSAESRAEVERMRPVFRRYQDYFGVPDEM